MKKNIIILCYSTLLCVLFSYNVVAQTFNYLPAEVNGHQTLTYIQFTLSYNEEHEQADWVAYELTKDEASMKRGLKRLASPDEMTFDLYLPIVK